MARRDAVLRVLVGVWYLPLYYVILYPLVFLLGIIVAALDVVFALVTGRNLTLKPAWTTRAWEDISGVVTWIFGGKARDKPGWVP